MRILLVCLIIFTKLIYVLPFFLVSCMAGFPAILIFVGDFINGDRLLLISYSRLAARLHPKACLGESRLCMPSWCHRAKDAGLPKSVSCSQNLHGSFGSIHIHRHHLIHQICWSRLFVIFPNHNDTSVITIVYSIRKAKPPTIVGSDGFGLTAAARIQLHEALRLECGIKKYPQRILPT